LAIRRVFLPDKTTRLFQTRMNLTFAQQVNKSPQHTAPHLPRILAALLCVLLTALPALADTVSINQVVQTVTSSQGTPDLKLNTLVSQDPISSGTKGSTQQSGPRSDSAAPNDPKTASLTSTVIVNGEGLRLGVEIVEEGEVEGTICDCGEILVAAGAFPKWPLLFLAAVPLVFINDCDDCDDTPSSSPTPTPTPPSDATPTPTQTPEPASLLLFGTGLLAAGAGFRRRYARAKLAEQIKAQEEE
jgi:PEP-CTERM motif